MNKKIEQLLFNTYPKWFSNKENLTYSLMSFGFCCGDGWAPLIKNLFEDIENLLNQYSIPQNYLEITQVKQKLGELRVYTRFDKENLGSSQKNIYRKIINLINITTKYSKTICEKCGEKGELRNIRNWFTTLCNKHYKEKLNNKIYLD